MEINSANVIGLRKMATRYYRSVYDAMIDSSSAEELLANLKWENEIKQS